MMGHIKRKVNDIFFFLTNHPYLIKISEAVNEDDQLPNFKRTKIYKVMKNLGFKFSIRGNNAFLIDRGSIFFWRWEDYFFES